MSAEQLPASGPCEPARHAVETSCSEAERLAAAAVAQQERLAAARRQLADASTAGATATAPRDRRELAAAKDAARERYRAALATAEDDGARQRAVGTWLGEISDLNWQFQIGGRRGEIDGQALAELERSLPGLELAANAARVAAEAAQATCLEARRELARCEEQAQQAIRPPAPQRPAGVPAGVRPISVVLSGPRDALIAISAQLAAESGAEPTHLQLLLLELREQVFAHALDQNSLGFPPDHPFWSQFPPDVCRDIVTGLAGLGYRFDGGSGWVEGRAPSHRDVSMALAQAGLDPRTLRRPPDQDAVARLWQGVVVQPEAFLAGRAPSLDLQQVVGCLGDGAMRLTELWDMWGRLRVPLLTPG